MNYNIFEWTPSMSVNEVKIDLQHKQLLNQVNVVLSELLNKLDNDTVKKAVDFLSNYIETHLKFEEEYMVANSYPNFDMHKQAHTDFIVHYEEFKKRFEGGADQNELALEIEQYIGNWWVHHIGEVDHKYAEYIASIGK
jgi:hemerythrin